MAPPAGALGRAIARIIAHRARIVAADALADDFLAITLEASGFRGMTWTPGAKVQIAMGSVFDTRTYTPIRWDAERGRTRVVGFLHGDGPGCAWLREARVGDGCDILGPRHSLDLRKADGPVAFFGDETSIGLACALSRQRDMPFLCRLEAGDTDALRRAAGALGLGGVEVVTRTASEDHHDALTADLSELAAARASFILTGKA